MKFISSLFIQVNTSICPNNWKEVCGSCIRISDQAESRAIFMEDYNYDYSYDILQNTTEGCKQYDPFGHAVNIRNNGQFQYLRFAAKNLTTNLMVILAFFFFLFDFMFIL